MSSAAPIFDDPTNHVLSDFPFAHSRAGAQCYDAIRRAFNIPSDDHAQSVLLHLRTLNGPILLEMEARILAGGSERCVVLTGRELNADLAGLIDASSSDGTLADVGGDNERAETTSTIISELTGDTQSHDDDGNHHPTRAATLVPPANRDIIQMADPVTIRSQSYASTSGSSSYVVQHPPTPANRDNIQTADPVAMIRRRPVARVRRRNYASDSGSSSIMTPDNALMPETRRSVWYANEAARLQLEEQRQWNASVVQRAWRLRSPGILYPRSVEFAAMAMRSNRNGTFEEVWHLIAVFISGVPTHGR